MNDTKLRWTQALAVSLLFGLGGCDLLQTEHGENATGRGPQVFDPYTGTSSIRLGLQWFGECAFLPNGLAVAKGSMDIPYPDVCPTIQSPAPNDFASPPFATFRLVSNTTYFLNQLTFMDQVVGRHLDYANPEEALGWMQSETVFAGLDWTGANRFMDEWTAAGPGIWAREVYFGNASWMAQENDEFFIEILDAEGNVRSSQTYSRRDFLSQGHVAGHSRFSWRVEGVQRPQFPNDPNVHPFDEFPPTYRSTARMDLVGSTNPFNSFTVGALSGEGAIRVTWSQLPERPFYVPVVFVDRADVPATCFSKDDPTVQVACDFGLDPKLALQTPANQKGYYEPGETVALQVALRDASGNLLHPKHALPSYASFFSGADEQNGLLYYYDWHFLALRESDLVPQFGVSGPLQEFATLARGTGTSAFVYPPERWGANLVDPIGDAPGGFPSAIDATWSTQYRVTLPPDAKPGTYVALIKANRGFFGERMTKLNAVTFQVGQEEATNYPGRVGNCQICHRGVNSLDNVRHGLSVDHVEACSTCHGSQERFWPALVHRLHVLSPKYSMDKRDCGVCHLTQESTTTASIAVCSSCHQSLHGNDYFDSQFTTEGPGSRFASCAQACHDGTPPTQHIVPAL